MPTTLLFIFFLRSKIFNYGNSFSELEINNEKSRSSAELRGRKREREREREREIERERASERESHDRAKVLNFVLLVTLSAISIFVNSFNIFCSFHLLICYPLSTF